MNTLCTFQQTLFNKTNRLTTRGSNSLRETDRQIIGLLRQKGLEKRRGEESLFNEYAYFIRDGMRKHRLSEEEAFDAYSDSVLVAIESISNETFKGDSSIKSYLYKIFHNKCVDFFRKNSTNKNSINRAQSINDELFRLSDKSRSIIQTLIDKMDWQILKQKLEQLGDDCRKMLLLWADSHSDREIAALMEFKTADVVKTSRLRCLAKLRQLYHAI
jgi:RNA polymerase sigma factor (sigma-70 family)